jgi:hypothetical protein
MINLLLTDMLMVLKMVKLLLRLSFIQPDLLHITHEHAAYAEMTTL